MTWVKDLNFIASICTIQYTNNFSFFLINKLKMNKFINLVKTTNHANEKRTK